MPTIYDNIDEKLLDGLKEAMKVSRRVDFFVGYFNRGNLVILLVKYSASSTTTDMPIIKKP